MINKAASLVSIVEDDESVREATSSLIRAEGFRTECFASAAEFLNSAHIATTKCLVLDLEMPGMSGIELQSALAKENRRIPNIFITAHASPENREKAMRAGASDFLPKPFSAEALLGAIHRALTSKTNIL